MFERMREDIQSIFDRDPAARSTFEVVLTYSGLHAIWLHRIAHRFWKMNGRTLARLISQFARWVTGIEIHPGAKIGRRVFIDHGMGVVIGETAEVGDDCTLYQGVTLGGTGKEKGKRHPTLGNNVLVASGAKVLGSFTIGDNSRIGAGSVVLRPVPPNSTVVGIPGRIVMQDGRRVEKEDACRNLDQVNLGDPVMELLKSMQEQIETLQAEVNHLRTEATKTTEEQEGGTTPNVNSSV
jgi:serine O-acetyltransferase